MRLGYFTMPVHPMHRDWRKRCVRIARPSSWPTSSASMMRSWGSTSPTSCETITNSMMFLGTLIPETKTIKLATGTSNLSHMHPVLVAQHAAMFDHLSQGRFIFGVSPGALTSDAEALGILEQDRNKMFAESIDVILAIWERDPPYDIDFPDNRYKVSTSRTIDLPLGIGYLFKPYPEAAAGDRRHRGGAVLARRRPHGAARLPSAVGELPAVGAPQVALDRITARARPRPVSSRRFPIGASRAPSASPTTTRPRRATAATMRTARTGSTGTRCIPR